MSYKVLTRTLWNICRNYKNIYTKGLEKSTYLSNLLCVAVIDLELSGCPSLKKLNIDAPRCFHKNHRAPNNLYCGPAECSRTSIPEFMQQIHFQYMLNDHAHSLQTLTRKINLASIGLHSSWCVFGHPPVIAHHKMFVKRNSNQYMQNNFQLQNYTSN
ncbi:hypothetical protein J437_LFUL005888, partial [Ladona fulva]